MKLRRECAALRPELPWPTHGACLVPGALRLYALNFEWRSIHGRDDVEEEPDIARTGRVVGDHIPFYHSRYFWSESCQGTASLSTRHNMLYERAMLSISECE